MKIELIGKGERQIYANTNTWRYKITNNNVQEYFMVSEKPVSREEKQREVTPEELASRWVAEIPMRLAIWHSPDEVALEWYKWKQEQEITKINEENGIHELYQPNEEELNKFKKEMKLARERIIQEEYRESIKDLSIEKANYAKQNNLTSGLVLVIIVFLSTIGCSLIILNRILIKVRKAASELKTN